MNHRAAGMISGLSIAYPHGGRRVPDIALADGRRLYEALRDGKFLMAGPPGVGPGGWADRVEAVTAARQPPTLTLIRPDGYRAWTGERADLPAALARWCGEPTALAQRSARPPF